MRICISQTRRLQEGMESLGSASLLPLSHFVPTPLQKILAIILPDALGLQLTIHLCRFLFGGPWETGTFDSMESDYVVGLKDDGTIYLAIESDRGAHQAMSVEVAIREMMLEDGNESDSENGTVSLDEDTREWWSLVMAAVDGKRDGNLC